MKLELNRILVIFFVLVSSINLTCVIGQRRLRNHAKLAKFASQVFNLIETSQPSNVSLLHQKIIDSYAEDPILDQLDEYSTNIITLLNQVVNVCFNTAANQYEVDWLKYQVYFDVRIQAQFNNNFMKMLEYLAENSNADFTEAVNQSDYYIGPKEKYSERTLQLHAICEMDSIFFPGVAKKKCKRIFNNRQYMNIAFMLFLNNIKMTAMIMFNLKYLDGGDYSQLLHNFYLDEYEITSRGMRNIMSGEKNETCKHI